MVVRCGRALLDHAEAYRRFDRLGSPTSIELPAGTYAMWAHTASGDAPKVILMLGVDGLSERIVDLKAL